jgi:outer membrane receptor for ferrienterochelin and colicins
VARGFRGPSFKELAWDFPNPFAGYTIRGDPGLTPERSWQTSAGLSWSAGGGVVLSGEAYRNSIRDLIELTAAGTDAGSGLIVFSPRNVRRARTQGVELGARWADADWLASAEYNYLDAEDLATGARLDRRARHSARLRLGRELAAPGRLRADLTLAYTGSAPAQQSDGSAGRQDDLLSTNAQVQWQAYDDVSIGVGVDNLFDARPSGWTGLVGRRVYLGLGTSLHP